MFEKSVATRHLQQVEEREVALVAPHQPQQIRALGHLMAGRRNPSSGCRRVCAPAEGALQWRSMLARAGRWWSWPEQERPFMARALHAVSKASSRTSSSKAVRNSAKDLGAIRMMRSFIHTSGTPNSFACIGIVNIALDLGVRVHIA